MTDTPLADQPERDRIRGDLDTTLVVEAAAGTGKTTELVRRIVATLMAGHAQLDGIVAVTFTEAAAGELKLRLRTAIERERQRDDCPPEARARLNAALPQLEEARIGTIHSFCADLLRERPVEARVDPLFAIAPEDVARPLFERAFARWFEAQLAAPGEGVKRVLRRRGRDDGPRAILRSAAWELVERRDYPTPWRRDTGFDRNAAIDTLMDDLAALGAAATGGNADDYFVKSLLAIGAFVDEVRRREEIRKTRDHDGLEAELLALSRERHWKWTGYRSGPPGFPKAELKERRTAVRARLDTFLAATGADLAPRLRDDLWPIIAEYERLKERAGCLDFLDLLIRARDLIREDDGTRAELQRRFTRVFVDEFQDTDPLQAEILLLLTADDPRERDWRRVRPLPGKLFVVGDPKQSIYRFRRADVALYEEVKRRLVANGAKLVELRVSFRAVPDIQQAVNAAFAPRMQGDSPSQARYVPLAPFRPAHPSQPAVVALPVPEPYSDWAITEWAIEESLPDTVAAFVDWVVRKSGWTVVEHDVRVPVAQRHVCILFRRFRSFWKDVTHDYVRALEARHLKHLLVGGTSFHAREEVEAVRNALAAIERPEDELAVFATLRGPFFALGDAALLAFRTRCGSLHPFRRVPDDVPEPLREIADALAILRDLHRERNRRPLADTIGRLLAATRAHAGVAIWPTGEQALANVTRLLDLARRAERNGTISFRSFVDHLADQAERGEASDAPIVEEGTDGVRIMTVHRAKGLEFPIVVLADLGAAATRDEPMRWVDNDRRLSAIRLAGCAPPELLEHASEELAREREEAERLLYVAATRARDLLVVTTVSDARHGGWLGALDPAVYPADENARMPDTQTPAGCPSFGHDCVATRPDRIPRPAASVSPGLHRPEAGAHRVVWWDPSALELGAQETVGLKQKKLLEADESGARSEEGVRAHARWQEERVRVRAAGRAPSMRVSMATEHAAAANDAADDVVVEAVGDEGERPHGRRFGTLVHAVLAAIDLDAGRPAIEAVAAWQGRIVGASPEEIAAAAEAAHRALAHPLLVRAAAAAQAGRCRRETPVSIRLDDGALVEGVVDAAFVEEGTWTVVDFKTDVEIAGRMDEYRRQLGLYGRAIAAATGMPARAVLLRV